MAAEQGTSDRLGVVLSITRSLFPNLAGDAQLDFHVSVSGNYTNGLPWRMSLFVAPAAEIANVVRDTVDSQALERVLLHGSFRLDESGGFDAVHFHGRAIYPDENEKLTKEVDEHVNWQRRDVMRRLTEMNARCNSKSAVLANVPIKALQVVTNMVRVRDVEFGDRADQGGEESLSRSVPYVWHLTLESLQHRGRVYAVTVEPFACAVTDLVKVDLRK